MPDKLHKIDELLHIMAALRHPDTGCPWDKVQNFASIAPYTIEESYEVADAIEREDWDDLKDELGDLLFQSVYHARLAEEQNLFDFQDVITAISDKMLERHPHVFGNSAAKMAGQRRYPLGAEMASVAGRDNIKTADEQVLNWEDIKAAERLRKAKSKELTHDKVSVLDDIPTPLPALTRAKKISKKAAASGFDWEDISGILAKVREELEELEVEIKINDRAAIAEEYGDLLFAMVNLGRWLKQDPEASLRAANVKFVKRFKDMEQRIMADGFTLDEAGAERREEAWEAAKKAEKLAKIK